MKLCLIFRKPDNRSFSIENVFLTLIPFLQEKSRLVTTELKYRRLGFREIAANARYLRSISADICHVTGDVHYAILFLKKKNRAVLTIHDCVFMNGASGWKKWVMKKYWLTLPIRRAAAVTTISVKSKEEIVRLSGCSPDKIRVIPNAVSDRFQKTDKPFNIDKPEILFVGTKQNKNLERSVIALKDVPCRLVIIGPLSDHQKDLLHANNIVFFQKQGISDEEIVASYKEADILLYPSLYEGFGLPILEAQKTGRIVVTSDISPMKDVAGGSAILVTPEDVESIRGGILNAIHNHQLRESLVSNGYMNVKHYDSCQISEQYFRLYQELLKNG